MKTLILLLLPAFVCAQDWAPIGAKWTFSQKTANPNYESYTTFESISDDTVGGRNCKAIREIARRSPVTADTGWHYMYSDSNRVYSWGDTAWCLLHDFNTVQYDSFHLGCHFLDINRPQSVVITSLDTVMINGHSKKLFEYDSPSFWSEYSGPVIEGIGHVLYMFPIPDQIFPPYTPGPLRCYEDSIIGLYKNQYYYSGVWTEDCDKILTDIREANKPLVRAFPNPVSYQPLQVELAANDNLLELTDVFGRVLIHLRCARRVSIDLSVFPDGIYLLRINGKGGTSITEKIIKSAN